MIHPDRCICNACTSAIAPVKFIYIFCTARTDTQHNAYLKLAHVLSVVMQNYRRWPGSTPDPAGELTTLP